MRETDLYPPLKAYLEAQGYAVKAEIGDCDLMARRGDEPPVVVEMKLTFSLALVLQGVARLALFDTVYLAVPVSPKRGWGVRYREVVALCRRLGLGLLVVRLGEVPMVEAHLDPAPYAPRRNAVKLGRLLREFERRVGDPNAGGTTGVQRMTHYRQDALRCAAFLNRHGATRAIVVARGTGVERAPALMRADHYGWFERVARGTYGVTPKGIAALEVGAGHLPELLPGPAEEEHRMPLASEAPGAEAAPAISSCPEPFPAPRGSPSG